MPEADMTAADVHEAEPPTWGFAVLASGLLPFALYVWTTPGAPYWLDSGEFTAAAIGLDIPHPPGHPLASLWGKLWSLLPVGPLGFRVALGQAAASALGFAALHVAFARTLRAARVPHVSVRALLALGGTLLLACSYAFWFQSVRAEVYALQFMLAGFAFERVAAWSTSADKSDARPLYAAALALGCGLANHHLVSFLVLPSLLWGAVRVAVLRKARPILFGIGAALLGLLHYAYLPLRARTLPRMDLGHPVSLDSIAWVVSARVYAKNYGGEALQPADERFADLAVLLVENLLAPTLVLALLGLYVLARTKATRSLAYLWGIALFIDLGGRAWLGPVRGNPDILGYMMPGLGAVMAAAVCGVGTVISRLARARGPSLALAALFVGAALPAQLVENAPRSSLASFHAVDEFDDLRRRALPQNAVVVAVTPTATFGLWDGEAREHVRPDLVVVPLPFLGYPGTADALIARHPELAPLVRAYLATRVLPARELLALGETRPVLIENDAFESLPVAHLIEPGGNLYYRLRGAAWSRSALERRAAGREALLERLYARLGSDLEEVETRSQLLWIHYSDALYYAGRGLHAEARIAAKKGLHLQPRARELLKLDAALAKAPAGPLDVRAFLVPR